MVPGNICRKMTSNDIFLGARVARVRELKDENARLKASLEHEKAARSALDRHMALAVLAARDAASLPPGGRIVVLDGWNIVLGARPGHAARRPPSTPHERRSALAAHAIAFARAHEDAMVWTVYDGAEEGASVPAPRVRVSYTGGEGSQRADRLILDFLRVLGLSGQSVRVTLVTGDRDLRRSAEKLGAEVISPDEFDNIR